MKEYGDCSTDFKTYTTSLYRETILYGPIHRGASLGTLEPNTAGRGWINTNSPAS